MPHPRKKLIARIALIGLTISTALLSVQCSNPYYYGGNKINNLYVPRELYPENQPAQAEPMTTQRANKLVSLAKNALISPPSPT